MFRRLAQCAFYLLLLVSGEEFEGVVVDSISTAQHAGQRYDSHVPTLRTQRLEQSSCSRNSSTTD